MRIPDRNTRCAARGRIAAHYLELLLCVLAAAVSWSPPTARAGEFDLAYHPTRVIVQFQSGTTASAKQDAHAAIAGVRPFWQSSVISGLEVVEVPNGQVQASVLSYRRQPGVLWAEPSYRLTALDIPNDTRFSDQWGLHNTSQTVNGADGHYDADVDAPLAWDIWEGGSDCVVAVVDTGVDYMHPDIYLNIWINQGEIPQAISEQLTDVDDDGIISFFDLNNPINQGAGKITDLNGNGHIDAGDTLRPLSQGGWADGNDDDTNGKADDLHGWDAQADDRDPNPTGVAHGGTEPTDPAHGTQVAGVIAAIGNNSQGIIGLARGCRIVPLKIADDDGALFSGSAVMAVDYLIANAARYNIRVSNHSWAIGVWRRGCLVNFPQALYDSFAALDATGQHIAVVAAGNDLGGCYNEKDNDIAPVFPANFGVTRDYTFQSRHVDGLDSVLSVAATTSDDGLAGFSHYGVNTVHLAAPGASVLSTWFYGSGSGRTYQYTFDDGTSLAAPHVAAVTALLWSRFPAWTMHEVRDRVLSTGRAIPSLDGKTMAIPSLDGTTTDERMLNAYRAMSYDCNDNGVDDTSDISSGVSVDCLDYETDCCVPHDSAGCDDSVIEDCVCTELPDCCNEALSWNEFCVWFAESCSSPLGCQGTSDFIPDECQVNPDCQGNGIPDPCDISCGDPGGRCDIQGCGTATDCDGDCTPDDCDLAGNDCNSNSIHDSCDILLGTSADCDLDGVPDECGEDCDANGVLDWCDVASGDPHHCDRNLDGVPDDCVACCNGTSCENMLSGQCTGSAKQGVICSQSTCWTGACCDEYFDCAITEGSACEQDGGYFVGVGTCASVDCRYGACCDGATCDDNNGQGYFRTVGCDLDGFIPGARCDPNPALHQRAPCSESADAPAVQIIEADPRSEESYAVVGPITDARYPHDPNDSSVEAHHGIGTSEDPIIVTLADQTTGADDLAWWRLFETGIEETTGDPLGSNAIASITDNGGGEYEIVLTRPISAGEWTVITYVPGCSSVCYSSLPGDVDNS